MKSSSFRQTNKLISKTSVVIAISLAGSFFAYADQLVDTRNLVQEWVSVEKTISQEKTAWVEDKALLGDILRSLDQEEKILRETIANAEQDTSRADQERVELVSKRDDYQASTSLLRDRLSLYERQAIQIIPQLPIILQDEMGLLINKITASEIDDYSLSERAQTLVGILTAIQEFDNNVTVATEIRETTSGEEVEVKVLFLGLSRGFYVDSAMTTAGIGRPIESVTTGGWNWVEQIDLADEINRAINIYENRESPTLVSLPMHIKEGM